MRNDECCFNGFWGEQLKIIWESCKPYPFPPKGATRGDARSIDRPAEPADEVYLWENLVAQCQTVNKGMKATLFLFPLCFFIFLSGVSSFHFTAWISMFASIPNILLSKMEKKLKTIPIASNCVKIKGHLLRNILQAL